MSGPWEMYEQAPKTEQPPTAPASPEVSGDGPWAMGEQQTEPVQAAEPVIEEIVQPQTALGEAIPKARQPETTIGQPLQTISQRTEQPTPTQAPVESTRDLIDNLGGYKRFFDIVSGATREVTGQAFRSAAGIDITQDVQLPTIEASPDLPNRARLGIFLSSDPIEKARIISENIPEATFTQDDTGHITTRVGGAEYVLQREGPEISDAKKFVAENVVFGPASKAKSLLGAIAGSGLTQAILEGIKQQTGGFFDEQEVVIASALSGAGKSLENIISTIGNYRRAGRVPADQQAILDQAKTAGIPIMTTDLVEPETLSGKLARSAGETIPFAGTGGQRAEQQAMRERLTDRFAEGVVPRYDEVVKGLKEKGGRIRRSAGDRLGRIGQSMDQVGEIDTRRTIQAIDDEIDALTRTGRVPDETTVATLEKYKTAIEEGQLFTSMDTLRSDFREAVRGERQSLPTRSDAASNRIYKAMTDDLDSAIRQNPDMGAREADRFKQAKGVYAREMDTLKKARLKSVLDKGDVTPESVKNILMSQKPSEMVNLYRRLDDNGRSAARMTVLSEILEKAGNRVGGLTPNSLATQLRKNKNQVDIFFKGEERDQLRGLQKLLDATRRAQDAKVATPTGQQLLGILGPAGVITSPVETILGGGTVGAMARIYESAPIRNALVRINAVKGDARDRAFIEAANQIQAAIQAGKGEALSAGSSIAETLN